MKYLLVVTFYLALIISTPVMFVEGVPAMYALIPWLIFIVLAFIGYLDDWNPSIGPRKRY